MLHNVIVIGWINKNKTADCGETMKNQLLIKNLKIWELIVGKLILKIGENIHGYFYN